jgi:CheY-like chemotaxis protein/anti-sigma regulatory factor (Ser/Thr protein kinase)
MASILVADDDPGVLLYLKTVLERDGHTVSTAKDGLEAMVIYRTGSFDLLVIDVHMPKLSGLEVLEKLAAEIRPARAIVLTGDDTTDVVLGAAARQAVRFVPKPVLPDALTAHVRAALARKVTGRAIRVLSAKRDWVELVVPCELDAVEQVRSFLTQLDADLSEEMRTSIGQAFHELLSNAIEWGGGGDPEREVRIAYLRTKRMVLYRIADPGPGFKFEHLDHAAGDGTGPEGLAHVRVREEKGLRPGGFGLMMTRALVDELIYNQAQNEVVFVKYLDES